MEDRTFGATLQYPAPIFQGNQSHQEDFSFHSTSNNNGKDHVLASYLYKKFTEESWIDDELDNTTSFAPGVIIRSESKESCSVHPHNAFPELSGISSKLGITAGFTMRSKSVNHLVGKIRSDQTEFTLMPHRITIPVVQSLQELELGRNSVMHRDHACFVLKERVLLLWSRTPEDLTDHATDMEGKLIDAMWGRPVTKSMYATQQRGPAMLHDNRSLSNWDGHSMIEKHNYSTDALEINGSDEGDDDDDDAEKQKIAPRPFVLTQTLIVSTAAMLIFITTSGGIVKVLGQVKILGREGYPRLAFLIMIPFSLVCCLFFFMIIVNSGFQLLGPIKDVRQGNSRFYSSVKPQLKKHRNMRWPHITIQVPVYKEGLKGVIQPTINSLLPAIADYERLGGTASIFVADDGMQVISAQQAEQRQNFYQQLGIGWVARPGHGQDGFVRGGRFKKASNLNYALDFTLRLEDELLRLIAQTARQSGRNKDDLSIDEENELYEQALATIIKEDQGRTQACGNVRMGEIILLIDSDTRVPVDCLSLAAMEMDESPEVAIIQHASGVLKVTDTWFEECIKFFTEIIYLSIRFSVGSGDAAPFVGHNAFLRWQAMQTVRFTDKDGRELFWSESHVSEDFDMALRLQTGGFIVRLATYDNGGFKEGVSLTIFDELLRWEKYAYGCSELLFHPVYQWLWKGPVTPMVWRIIGSNMKVTSKFTIFAYVFTYYAIAMAMPLSLVMYLVTGWFGDDWQIVTFEAWQVFLGVVIVFQGICPLCFAVYRHRVGDMKVWNAYFQCLRWSPFFMVFFAGLSWHLLYALIAHMFCLPIEWASTAKELEATGFYISFDRVLKTFKWSMLVAILCACGMVYLGQFAPGQWRINYPTGILPFATQVAGHIALPILCLFH